MSDPKRAQALHVTKVNWVNDDVMTLDELVSNGLVVELDEAPTGPITGANFIVTIEGLVMPARGFAAAGIA